MDLKGKHYEIPPTRHSPFKLEYDIDTAGNPIYNITTQITEAFNTQQEEFIVRAITRIGEEYGLVFCFNKTKIAEALSKAMPKKVKNVDRGPIDIPGGDHWYTLQCPHCDTAFRIYECRQKPAYCCECGQHLDWSDIH